MEPPHLPQGGPDSAKAADGPPTPLAESLVRDAGTIVTAGANPMALKRGIDRRVEAVIAEITKLSKPTKGKKEISQVATISASC